MKVLNIIKFIFVIFSMLLLVPMLLCFFILRLRYFLQQYLDLDLFYFLSIANGGIIFIIELIQRKLELKKC